MSRQSWVFLSNRLLVCLFAVCLLWLTVLPLID